jgi:hypothetical protein
VQKSAATAAQEARHKLAAAIDAVEQVALPEMLGDEILSLCIDVLEHVQTWAGELDGDEEMRLRELAKEVIGA